MEKQPIIIHFGVQREGFTFRLHPLSLLQLEELFPDRNRLMSVYIGYDRSQNRPDIHHLEESVWDHVSNLLTGLSKEELNQLGGFAAVNSLTKEEVYHSLRIYA